MEKRLAKLIPGGRFQNVDPKRSRTMGRIRAKNTKPEMVVRSLLHRLGYRFRLHRAELPGKPDIVFPTKRKAIWVHGCFWHRHGCQLGRRRLRTNTQYWHAKLIGNEKRDRQHRTAMERLGWGYLVVWECEITPAQLPLLAQRLRNFMTR
jgi:DNA mismatch endonuclease, patch repair protein